MQTTLNASTSAAVSSPAASRTQVRILAAAEELLRSGGAQALNMRALADAAGVSIATPYNVFGSKEAVLLAVMNNDLQAHQSAFARASRGDLTDLFAACRITIEHLTADPDYFRALLSALHHTGNQDLRLLFAGPRYLLWKGLLNRARTAGELREDLNADALAITVCQQLSAPVMEWVQGGLSATELAARARYGLAMVLLGAATEPARRIVEQELQAAQDTLQNIWQALLRKRLQQGPLSDDEAALAADLLPAIESSETTPMSAES